MSVVAEKFGVRREFACNQWALMGGTSSGWAVISDTCGQYSENIRSPYASYGYPDGIGDKHFRYIAPSSAAVWRVEHGLGKRPSVRVIDSAGTRIKPVVIDIDENTTELRFFGGGQPAATGGEAFFN